MYKSIEQMVVKVFRSEQRSCYEHTTYFQPHGNTTSSATHETFVAEKDIYPCILRRLWHTFLCTACLQLFGLHSRHPTLSSDLKICASLIL